ncbi:Cro Cl family transcriptional regulator, putative [Babesia ovata]|uniref:Cro Cl family transcriptional regulator, putative n=1 Tax=Babesia ovata TaxID=189622 RepID=A0A2H6K9S7_9APIC|nr:Cro Cl family transcriptional regulator, putative [Babesia ovata]GBE59740.1 Cro Cl family transcriptional regulator, putative [Babesia ovata]
MGDGFDPLLKYNRKKQPDIPEKARQRLYGIPGRNIFNYDVEIPKERKFPPPNLDKCMIPKENAKVLDSNIPRMSIALRSSLEESLLPKEECVLRRNSKQVSSKTYQSHIEPGYVATEQPVKTAHLSPFRYTTNLEAGLVPASDEPWQARRHFSEANAHSYDCMSHNQHRH